MRKISGNGLRFQSENLDSYTVHTDQPLHPATPNCGSAFLISFPLAAPARPSPKSISSTFSSTYLSSSHIPLNLSK